MQSKYKANRGFTLIELLVVIEIIAVLMGILMPALRAVKQQAAAINCMANCRSLATAWFMYAGDNEGSVLGFCDGHAEKHTWVNRFTLERVDKVLNQGGQNYGQQPAEEGQTEDIDYMAKGWAYEQK